MIMSLIQKRDHFRKFLVEKFSLDPKRKCMLPGPGAKRKKRNDACWNDFWLTDAELDGLVQEVMVAYTAVTQRENLW